QLRQGFLNYLPIGALIGVVLLAELLVVLGGWAIEAGPKIVPIAPTAIGVSNTAALGAILYTRYILLFQAARLVPLVAMIGAIVLTLRHKAGVKRQSIAVQVARPAIIDIRKVEPGSGLT